MASSSIFSGAGALYAASNLRYNYYRDMARMMVTEVQSRAAMTQNPLKEIVDVGAGIGISTRIILHSLEPDHLVAFEPEESMLSFLRLIMMGDPRVRIHPGRAENFSEGVISVLAQADAVFFCQMFHLLNPPQGSLVPKALAEASKVLRPGGLVGFDLGPSNYQFALRIADHRIGICAPGEILTELAHPLMQKAHDIMLRLVKREYPAFDRDNLWPSPAARMNRSFLENHLTQAGFRDVQVREDLLPISGEEMVEYVRNNGLATFFRWPPLDEVPVERKLELITLMAEDLFQRPEFQSWKRVRGYHPTAIITAIRGES